MINKRRGKRRPHPTPVLSPQRAGPERDARPLVDSWWGRRWLESVMLLDPAYIRYFGGNRNAVGAGTVRNLRISRQGASAQVEVAGRPRCLVLLRMRNLSADAWDLIIDALARHSHAKTELGTSSEPSCLGPFERTLLFPSAASGFTSHCSLCGERPACEHLVALHVTLANHLGKDPSALFLMRGERLGTVLAQAVARPPASTSSRPEPERPAVPDSAPQVSVDAAVATQSQPAASFASLSWEEFAGQAIALPELHFQHVAPPEDALILAQLGQVPDASDGAAWEHALAPAYRRFTELSLRLGLEEVRSPEEPSDK